MNAFADGLNYYLYKHPEVKPRVITRFEPWMALSFTEGSIGSDIERVNLNQLAAFYGKQAEASAPAAPTVASAGTGSDQQQEAAEPGGSNGVAIAPSNTIAHHALLLINPHTSFYFRSELQMVSDEGLDAYGAVTWGQFFVYQGFNPHVGWMHTSSGVNAISEYLETVEKKGGSYYYKYGDKELPVIATQISCAVHDRAWDGRKEIHRLSHPARAGDRRAGRQMGDRPPDAGARESADRSLTRAPRLRTTTRSGRRWTCTRIRQTTRFLPMPTGDIAYFHANFIPRRDARFDWTKPVDGSNPATDWHGVLSVHEAPHLLNPSSGWIYNSNDAPWSAAGPGSLKKEDFPPYVETGGESARGLHAVRLLEGRRDFHARLADCRRVR